MHDIAGFNICSIVDIFPQTIQIFYIAGNRFMIGNLCSGTDDVACIFNAILLFEQAIFQTLSFALTFDAGGNANIVCVWHEHQVT